MNAYAFHVVWLEFVFGNQQFQRIQHRLGGRAHGPALDIGAHNLERAAQIVERFVHISDGAVAGEKTDIGVQRIGDAGHARMHHGRGLRAGPRRHTRKDESFFRVLPVPEQGAKAARLLGGVRYGHRASIFIHAGQRGGGGHGAESPGEGMGILARVEKILTAEGQAGARASVIADRHGFQKFKAASALAFGHGEGGGHRRTAGMGQRKRVRIIGLIGMRRHAVGQRRLHSVGADGGAKHAGLFAPALASRISDRLDAGLHLGAGQDGGEGVQDVVLGFFDDRVRQGPGCGAGNKPSQFCRAVGCG